MGEASTGVSKDNTVAVNRSSFTENCKSEDIWMWLKPCHVKKHSRYNKYVYINLSRETTMYYNRQNRHTGTPTLQFL